MAEVMILYSPKTIHFTVFQQDRQLAKTSDILANEFQQSDTPKILMACMTQSKDILTTRTMKVTNHDSREDT